MIHELLEKKVYTIDNYLFAIHETKLAEVLKAMLVNNQLVKYASIYYLPTIPL